MNIAYCEDEKIQLEYMEQLIRKWADEGNDTVTYFGYGSAKELLFEHPDSFPFDLLLLDIDMDGMDGMALAKEIRKKDQKLPIVFLTNRSEYVFEGYEVGALRYLLKPVEETKLFSLLDEISYALGKERRYLIENVGGETVKIPVDTIYSVEAKGHYIRLHTSAGDYEYKKNLSATWVAGALGGVDPSIMGVGPVAATNKVMAKTGLSVDDMDLIEANEAFAAQSLAVAHDLKFDMDKVNVNGGAIALGHPVGASGCRILVTLLHEMQKRDAKKGLATLCIGGGMGCATIVERD